MDGDKELAERYRKRATEVRLISGTMIDDNFRKILDEIAKDYEQMARTLDEIDESDRQRGQPISN